MLSDPSTRSALTVGGTLAGKYRVVRRIGEGGMGVVVEAVQTPTGKHVALKWLHPSLAEDPECVSRIINEARACARVRHPNVIDVYDVVRVPNGVFIVMELLHGEALSACLAREDTPAHVLIGWLRQAMRGVAAAHKQGVIHRDIKPANIFLAAPSDGGLRTPVVLDFGISKLLDEAPATVRTRTGMWLGTPEYMSPEHLWACEDLDARTDVYAFGAILYEALTGRLPFGTPLYGLAQLEPPALRELRPDIPPGLEALVLRALAKDRDRRVSLDALIRALEPYCAPEAFLVQPSSSTLPPSDRADDAHLAIIVAEPPLPLMAHTRIESSHDVRESATAAVDACAAWTVASVRLVFDLALWAVTWPFVHAFTQDREPSRIVRWLKAEVDPWQSAIQSLTASARFAVSLLELMSSLAWWVVLALFDGLRVLVNQFAKWWSARGEREAVRLFSSRRGRTVAGVVVALAIGLALFSGGGRDKPPAFQLKPAALVPIVPRPTPAQQSASAPSPPAPALREGVPEPAEFQPEFAELGAADDAEFAELGPLDDAEFAEPEPLDESEFVALEPLDEPEFIELAPIDQPELAPVASDSPKRQAPRRRALARQTPPALNLEPPEPRR
jgi:serine/threonine protein kinase